MAVFPVWMVQPSPTPLCILVWRAISSLAHRHAIVWQMAHGLAHLQTAQVSFVFIQTGSEIYLYISHSCGIQKKRRHSLLTLKENCEVISVRPVWCIRWPIIQDLSTEKHNSTKFSVSWLITFIAVTLTPTLAFTEFVIIAFSNRTKKLRENMTRKIGHSQRCHGCIQNEPSEY